MKFAVCDDDPRALKDIVDLLLEYRILSAFTEFSIFSFSNGEDLLADIEEHGEYDVYLLDIVMSGMNGISLGNMLRKMGFHQPIIYLTSSEEYAIESYRVRALDYLLKPVKKEYLFSTLDTIIDQSKNEKDTFILLKTREGSMKIATKQILYARLSNRLICYHLTDGSIIKSLYLRSSFTDAVSPLLSEHHFVPCGVGMVVNLTLITKMENGEILFCDRFPVSVGMKAFRTLKSQWVDYCINEEEFL